MSQEDLQTVKTRVEGGRRTRGSEPTGIPLVSIITVVFNAGKALLSILENLLTHDPSNFELIVIDGYSSDGTVDLLHEWEDRIDYWLSEPDDGLYDAMNKAQKYARGEFLLHINAGDRLLYMPVLELQDALRNGVGIVSFRVSVDGTREFAPAYGYQLRLKNTLHHQGTFYRRETFLSYNLEYRRLADFDLNQRLALRGDIARCHDVIVAYHESGGIADNVNGYEEHKRILRANYGAIWMLLSIARSEIKGIWIRRTTALRGWLQKMGLARDY